MLLIRGRCNVTLLEKGAKKEETLATLAAGRISAGEASKIPDEAEWERRGRPQGKVSQKGAVSVDGLPRMPVPLDVEPRERLFDLGDQIREFIQPHDAA
jgi:hypothetical protein